MPNNIKPLSKRKLESYKRAELVAREVRYLIANNKEMGAKIADLCIDWMQVTGKIKNVRPEEKKP